MGSQRNPWVPAPLLWLEKPPPACCGCGAPAPAPALAPPAARDHLLETASKALAASRAEGAEVGGAAVTGAALASGLDHEGAGMASGFKAGAPLKG